MHFFYLDEAGCTGDDLDNDEQPVFVLGGVTVRDQGWNQTNKKFEKLVSDYFGGAVPPGFELHASDLLSPSGTGAFAGHDRNRRNGLVDEMLGLLEERKHQVFYLGLDKGRMAEAAPPEKGWDHVSFAAPYQVAFDYLITTIEDHTRKKLGQSARALVILDEKDQYKDAIGSITQHRRYGGPKGKRVKWIVEFSYAVDSRHNPMVQLSDLVCFITKKFLEVDAGYRDEWSPAAKTAFRDWYARIHDRLFRKRLLTASGRNSDDYNRFMNEVTLSPTGRWRKKPY